MKNKIVVVLIALFVLVSLFLVMSDDGSSASKVASPKSFDATTGDHSQQAQKAQKSEEEQKLEELKKEARKATIQTSHLYKTKCASCHGYAGEGTVGPSIAGKTEKEIMKSLEDYKANRVPNTLMAGLLTGATDDELKMLAAEISKF